MYTNLIICVLRSVKCMRSEGEESITAKAVTSPSS